MRFEVAVEGRAGTAPIRFALAAEGGCTVLWGPSGVGKTSILHMVAGLLRPDRGRIALGERVLFDAARGIDLPPERRRIGYVFQEPRLFPHRRVAANLDYGSRRGTRVIDRAEVVAALDLQPLLARWPAALSGGEARRVAIGRALLSGPELLLLDEPLSSLDPARREQVATMIEWLRDRLDIAMLYVTHDRGEAERLGTRMVAV